MPRFGWGETESPFFETIAARTLGGFTVQSDFAACLLPLLTALGWHGQPRDVAEALPHFADTLDLTGLRNVMGTLHFASRSFRSTLATIDSRLLPILFVPDHGPALVILRHDPESITVFNGETAALNTVSWTVSWNATKGTAFCFTPLEPETRSQQTGGWFWTVMARFRILAWQVFGLTLFLNVLTLAVPLFSMAVYDTVVATRSTLALIEFTVGVLLALAAEARILSLAPAYTERATVGSQVARIRDFESVREFFTGPLATVFIEVPFAVFYVIVIGILGGILAVVPMVALALFVALGALVQPMVRQTVRAASHEGSKRQEFVVEVLSKMRALKCCAAETIWLQRYRDLSARAAMAGFKTAEISSMVSTLAQMLTVAAGVATLALGVHEILAGTLTVGALIATMMLVWRVLSPLQMGFVTFTRFEQIAASVAQIDALMHLKPEREARSVSHFVKRLQGRVSFSRVSLRYAAEADPALVGVSFQTEPGEVVVVTGANGSGKSTVLKLIAGLYPPQAGAVRLDDLDIRQIDPIVLRLSIGYVPQTCNLFHGTVAQNLRLAKPTATDDELEWAMDQTGALKDILALPNGFAPASATDGRKGCPRAFCNASISRGRI
ncbi:MAG: ATP-binding cassette subfamily C bacterial [Rhodospirillaceae bacterium]|nr:MAG: ATP-binding cassette subfamily C bacterial [Rhodospirillaceae bacterium]